MHRQFFRLADKKSVGNRQHKRLLRGVIRQGDHATAPLHSSSTVGDASWPQLIDSKQGDACQREILVSRLIYKYLKTVLVMRLLGIHDSDTGAPTCSFVRRPTVPGPICSSWITNGCVARSSSTSCFVLAASMSCSPAASSTH